MTGSVRHPLLDSRVLLRGLVLIATLAAIGLLLHGLGLQDMLQTGWVDAEVRGKGATGEALLLLAGAAFTAIGLPRQVLAFLSGYALGFMNGTVLALAATMVGAVASFHYARFMGRAYLLRRFPHRLKKIDDFLAGNTAAMALVLRLAPFTNNLATNLAAGVSGARPLPFFAGSAAGYLPQTVIFALLGSGVALDPGLRMGSGVALFVLSTIVGIWLWRRTRGARGLSEELADAED